MQLSHFIRTALRISIRYTNKSKNEEGDVDKCADILDTIKSRRPEKAHLAVKTILDEALELIND